VADALGIAIGLHEYYRQSDLVQMANYAQTVNVIGCINTTRTQAEFATTGIVLTMYRQHYGQIPVHIELEDGDWEVAAALAEHGMLLTLSIVNPTTETRQFVLDTGDTRLAPQGVMVIASGPAREAFNQPGSPRAFDMREIPVSSDQALSIPPLSCVILKFAILP
jgi:alpha-L-arabinofuranosidase